MGLTLELCHKLSSYFYLRYGVAPCKEKIIIVIVVFNVKWAISQLYHGKIKLHSMKWCLLYTRLTLNWISIVLAHWTNSLWVDMSFFSDTLFWFWINQSLLLLLKAVYLAEKQQIPIIVFDWTRSGIEPMIYHTRGEHANHYTTDAVKNHNKVPEEANL